jgi:hypothetical protein
MTDEKPDKKKKPEPRRAGQTDDEVKEEIRAQLLPKTDGPRRASKKAAKKKGARTK